MKDSYQDRIIVLLNRVRPRLTAVHRLELKNVFGAVGGYINGHIFITHGKFGVALRLPPKTLDELFKERGVKHLKYFPKGHIKKEYAVLPERITENTNQFRKLVDESVQYVLK